VRSMFEYAGLANGRKANSEWRTANSGCLLSDWLFAIRAAPYKK
jgi:hypothetical protein